MVEVPRPEYIPAAHCHWRVNETVVPPKTPSQAALAFERSTPAGGWYATPPMKTFPVNPTGTVVTHCPPVKVVVAEVAFELNTTSELGAAIRIGIPLPP